MTVDRIKLDRFINARGTRQTIAAVVTRSGFTITGWIERCPELWGVYLKPNRPLRELFGTSQEILLWTSEFAEFQAKAITQAQQIITKEQPRLCDDFAIVVTADATTAKQVAQMTQQTQQQFVGFSVAQMDYFHTSQKDRFILSIQNQFYAKDLYNVTNVITLRRSFFGREGLVQQIRGTLLRGVSHAALFGIRKMGKTSLLFRLIEELNRPSNTCLAHIDMQRLDAIRPSADFFLWAIGEQLFAGNAGIRALEGFRIIGQHKRFPSELDSASVFEDFDHDIKHVIDTSDLNLIVMIDEIELMSPETPGSRWGNSYVRAWRLLRGLDQTSPGRLRFLIAGTNPRCIEANTIQGTENPTFSYFTQIYLQPLKDIESEGLLSSIGRRMGLKWDDAAARKAHALVGGHPLLLRLLGSAIHHATAAREETTLVTEATVQGCITRFMHSIGSSLSQMIEVLGDNYSSELLLLRTLADGKLAEFREFADAFPGDVTHLRGYGLISGTPPNEYIAIELLQSWLQERPQTGPGGASDAESSDLEAGQELDGYRIEGALGEPGGFGTVYRAQWSGFEGPVAFKVFRSGSLEQLEREVDVLKEVDHPGIVRILDHGKTSKGHVYLTTELVDGVPLRDYCRRAQRLSHRQVAEVLEKTLEALEAIHPDDARVAALKAKDSLTSEEYHDLNRAMHGYIHRDINPNNIIVRTSGEPVLIDFGISSRAHSRIVTETGTRGYRPPDGIVGNWVVDTDLYSLGLTMAQALVGIPLREGGTADLLSAVAAENAGVVAVVIEKLCAPTRSSRYSTAREALHDLRTEQTQR